MFKKSDKIPECKVIRNIPVNWKLLKKLLSYRTYSKDENARIEFNLFLTNWIKTNIKNVLVEEDSIGNIYITKGISEIYPCVVAHQDINQDKIESVSVIQTSKLIVGIDNSTGLQCGLGNDDKAGIYLALHCLLKYDNIKCFFSVNEEIGAEGSHAADLTFFENVSFLLQGDRNSWENDVSYSTNGEVVVSEEFMKASYNTLEKYNYSYASCMYTDIGVLCPATGLCGINISIGYFDEHYEEERLSIPHFINAIGFAEELIENMGNTVWENSYEDSTDYSHHTSGWKFQKEDEPYIQDCLEIGECPICMSTNLETLKSGTIVCNSCESYYNVSEVKEKTWQY